jgi:N-acetylmuramoyl-L-alanine amidase
MPAYTPDSIALGIIAEGRREAVTEKGICIALATGLVESNLTMYANEADPESMGFPHDAVGHDANSVGVFQQRAPWWGTVAQRMDVAGSAQLFYQSLTKQRIGTDDYNTDATTPGGWAQMVQRSAFPDRYDERYPAAQAIFQRLRNTATAPPVGAVPSVDPIITPPKYTEIDMMTGGGASTRTRPVTNFFLHTEEGNSTAQQLANYCNGDNNVSYHYTVRDSIVCDVVDTDMASWSVLDANVFSINLCYAGSRAGWSRDDWLKREQDIEISAYLAVQDCRKYGFSTLVIAPPYHRDAGISDHKYVTECLGIGNHVDVGDNYPWDRFKFYVAKYTGLIPADVPVPPVAVPPAAALSDRQLLQEVWDQLRGPNGNGWPQLGGRTLVDAVAELLPKKRAATKKTGQNP